MSFSDSLISNTGLPPEEYAGGEQGGPREAMEAAIAEMMEQQAQSEVQGEQEPGEDQEVDTGDSSTATIPGVDAVDGEIDGGQIDGGEGEGQLTPPLPDETLVDLNEISEAYYGQRLNREQAVGLFRVASDLQNLTPAQQQQLQEILYGEPTTPNVGTPNDYDYRPEAFQDPTPAATPPADQPRVTLPAGYEDDPDLVRWAESVNAAIEQSVSPLSEKLSALEQQSRAQAEREYHAQLAQYQATVNTTVAEWFDEHPELSQEESVALHAKASDNMVAGFMQQGLDTAAAIRATFDHLYWTDENLRQKYVEQQVAEQQSAIQENLTRKRKADALTGGGGAVSRTPAAPSTPQEAHQAKVREMSEILNRNI